MYEEDDRLGLGNIPQQRQVVPLKGLYDELCCHDRHFAQEFMHVRPI